LKPYPACGATHPAIEAALAACAELAGGPGQKNRVGHNEVMRSVLGYDAPGTGLEGKFSMQYCGGAGVAPRAPHLGRFSEASVANPAIRGMMSKVEINVDDRVRFNPEHGAIVEVTLRSGRRIEKFVPLAKGKPARWMTRADMWAKFEDCAAGVLGKSGAEE